MVFRRRCLRTWLKRPLFLVLCGLVLIGSISAVIKLCLLVWCGMSTIKSKNDMTIATRSIKNKFKSKEKCFEPQTNIVFLKTHKTGSSTITNILNRFAETHNLTVALPMDGFYHFLWPLLFQTDFVQNRLPKPNILSNHARFNARPLMELMPDTTKFITILRHPATQFISLFKFMDLGGLIAA